MYSLTICFGPSATTWAFVFKEKEKAEAIYNIANHNKNGGQFEVVDDYGQHASFFYGGVHGVLLEDLELTQELRILRSLDNARGEVKARQRASTDPVIRAASQGPAVLQPRFNG